MPGVRVFGAVVVLFVIAAVASIRAASPAVIMVYGGALPQPVFIGPRDIADMSSPARHYGFLFGGSTERFDQDLTGRPFLNLAMFWSGELWKKAEADPSFVQQLRPDAAEQHGRLYLPLNGEPAVVIATPFNAGASCRVDVDGNPVGGLIRRPAPVAQKGFPCGWTLGDNELVVLRSLKIPGV